MYISSNITLYLNGQKVTILVNPSIWDRFMQNMAHQWWKDIILEQVNEQIMNPHSGMIYGNLILNMSDK